MLRVLRDPELIEDVSVRKKNTWKTDSFYNFDRLSRMFSLKIWADLEICLLPSSCNNLSCLL